jgi:hypothetical protein
VCNNVDSARGQSIILFIYYHICVCDAVNAP